MFDYPVARDKFLDERIQLRRQLRVTIYGSFNPPSERDRLEKLIECLNRAGFHDVDIVTGKRRPNPPNERSGEEWGGRRISKYYLENSDMNILVYTHKGKRHGLISETEIVTQDPALVDRRWRCVAFNEVLGGRGAIPDLTAEGLEEIKAVRITEFETDSQLCDAAVAAADDMVRALKNVLRVRAYNQ